MKYSDRKDVINKAYLDTKLSKMEGELTLIEKDYNNFELRTDEQSEVVSIKRAVKMTFQTIHDKGLFDN